MVQNNEDIISQDLDYHNGMFGFMIQRRKGHNPLIHFYEDDDNQWRHFIDLDTMWIKEFVFMAGALTRILHGLSTEDIADEGTSWVCSECGGVVNIKHGKIYCACIHHDLENKQLTCLS